MSRSIELRGVVVVHGPGSFTGIRIGVSAAKGLAEGLGIPVIALSRLELLARQSPEGSAVAVLDAGRGEFYAGFYREGICETEALIDARCSFAGRGGFRVAGVGLRAAGVFGPGGSSADIGGRANGG